MYIKCNLYIYIHIHMCILSIYIHMCIWPFNAPNWPFNARFFQNGALKGQIGAAKGLVKLPSAARAAVPFEVELSWIAYMEFDIAAGDRMNWLCCQDMTSLRRTCSSCRRLLHFYSWKGLSSWVYCWWRCIFAIRRFLKEIGMLLFSFLPSAQCQSCGCNTCKMDSGSQSSC